MNKTLLAVSLLIVSSVVLSGCFVTNNGDNTASPSVTPQPTNGDSIIENDELDIATPSEIPSMPSDEEGVQVNPEVKITVDSTSYKFEPNVIEAKPGEIVQITLNNIEGFHDLVIDELNVKTKQIKDAGTDQVTFTIPEDTEVGTTYEYYCSVGKHREMGMVGVLKIV
ncbi:hypothetical protein KBD45_00970 [Candidatus Dojkabacteria bacterium]|nr:hypothetical protein [Candidatus Dojkabacteria bacterium]